MVVRFTASELSNLLTKAVLAAFPQDSPEVHAIVSYTVVDGEGLSFAEVSINDPVHSGCDCGGCDCGDCKCDGRVD